MESKTFFINKKRFSHNTYPRYTHFIFLLHYTIKSIDTWPRNAHSDKDTYPHSTPPCTAHKSSACTLSHTRREQRINSKNIAKNHATTLQAMRRAVGARHLANSPNHAITEAFNKILSNT